MKKNHEIYILRCIDSFSKYRSAEFFDNGNASNVIKFLDNYIQIHGAPRSLRFDQSSLSYRFPNKKQLHKE